MAQLLVWITLWRPAEALASGYTVAETTGVTGGGSGQADRVSGEVRWREA
jgi:hypothetical protein